MSSQGPDPVLTIRRDEESRSTWDVRIQGRRGKSPHFPPKLIGSSAGDGSRLIHAAAQRRRRQGCGLAIGRKRMAQVKSSGFCFIVRGEPWGALETQTRIPQLGDQGPAAGVTPTS